MTVREDIQRVTTAIKQDFGWQMNARPLVARPRGSDDWTAAGDPMSVDLEQLARAAYRETLLAVREPGDAALEKMGLAMPLDRGRWDNLRERHRVHELPRWQAAVDQLLKELDSDNEGK